MIVERVKSGLARARSQGRRLGRSPLSADKERAVLRQLSEGAGILRTARIVGVGVSVVQRIKAGMTTPISCSESSRRTSYQPPDWLSHGKPKNNIAEADAGWNQIFHRFATRRTLLVPETHCIATRDLELSQGGCSCAVQ
jgi:hypothetical protein